MHGLLCCKMEKMKKSKEKFGRVGKRTTHYTFTETMLWTGKRNPCLFRGKYISITRRDDGTLSPNFRPVRMEAGFSVDAYAIGVCNELRNALTGLVENK